MADRRRIAITGGPRTGKTTYAKGLGPYRSTDEAKDLGWSEASQEASTWFDTPGDLVVEGVAVPRALRKWLRANPEGAPVDRVVYLSKPHVGLSKGQKAMGKGVRTVFDEIRPELEKRGVEVEER